MIRRKFRITPDEEDAICETVWNEIIQSFNSDGKEKVYHAVSEMLNSDIDISESTIRTLSHSVNTDIDVNKMIATVLEARIVKTKRGKRKTKRK